MLPRVLIVVHGYPPGGRGGAEGRAARTARGLAERGCCVSVLAHDASAGGQTLNRRSGLPAWSDADEDGVRVRRIDAHPESGHGPGDASHDNAVVAAALESMAREARPDVVHLFSGYLMSGSVVTTARRLGIPVVVSLTDYWWFCHRINLLKPDGTRCNGPSPVACARCAREVKRRWRLPAAAAPRTAALAWRIVARSDALRSRLGIDAQAQRAAFLSAALAQADVLLAPSKFLAAFYARQGVSPGRIRVHRQGVPQPAAGGRVPADKMRFSYAGQIKAHKGVDLLLAAWSRLTGPRRRLLSLHGSAAGEDAYGRRVRGMVERLADARWDGEYAAGAAWDMLARTDALVVPSRWVENSPNVILEAQAMKVPVVGTDIGGIAELVTHNRDGLLFAADDAAALASQLQRLLDETGLLEALSSSAPPVRSLADEYDDLERLYRSLAAA